MIEETFFQFYRRSSLARIRSRNLFRSTSSACSASISAFRREISCSQASSAPLSCGVSRFWLSSWANSARFSSESARTSERSCYSGSAVVLCPRKKCISELSKNRSNHTNLIRKLLFFLMLIRFNIKFRASVDCQLHR